MEEIWLTFEDYLKENQSPDFCHVLLYTFVLWTKRPCYLVNQLEGKLYVILDVEQNEASNFKHQLLYNISIESGPTDTLQL